MSTRTLENQLDLVINLLESLPDRMIQAIEKSEEAKKSLAIKRINEEMEVARNNIREIMKMSGDDQKIPQKMED